MSGRVLIVEDDRISQKMVRDALRAAGYETDEVDSGELALQKVAEVTPDLIVMDIRLPVMDGLETTRRLKADPGTAAIPIVAVTAHVMLEDESLIRDAGCDAYMPKPLRFSALLEVVRDLLERRPPELGERPSAG
jgi:two-component system cell cycle response regulator DivK